MQNQVQLARQAEDAGFAALWGRDVPLRDSWLSRTLPDKLFK